MVEGQEQRRETRREWALRAATLVAAALLAALLVAFYSQRGVAADDAALGTETRSHVATFDGQPVAAYRVENYAGVYPGPATDPGGPEILWLGNSQLHAINQKVEGDETAPYHASVALGTPVRGLSLPNASFQEHLVVFRWALARRAPDTLVLAAVYDDLREDGLRPELEALADPALIADLESLGGEAAPRLADLLATLGDDTGAAIDAAGSWQERSEALLERGLSELSETWAGRTDTLSAVQLDLYRLRNRLLRIEATSVRTMIPVRKRRNTAALETLLASAREAGVRTLVYVVPLRWDATPPYDLDAYTAWKRELEALASNHGAAFAELDRLVPDELWGTYSATGAVDFMHFRGPGHRLLGDEIARRLR